MRATRAVPLLLAAGCGVMGSGGQTTTPRVQVSELPAPSPAATHYRSDATEHPGGIAAQLASAVIEAGASVQVEVTTDGRLAHLGRWAASNSQGGMLPPHGAIDAASHRLGLFEPTPALVIYRTNDAAALVGHVRTDIADLVRKRHATHVGVGVIEQDDSTTAVVVLSERKATLAAMERLPGAVPAIALRGSLAAGLTKPELVVMRPGGEIERSSLGAGPAFATSARLGPAGAYRIELLAHGRHGTTVVANFPLLAGVPEPATIRVETAVGGSEGDVAGALLALITRDRAAIGLGPLVRRSDLDAVALGHSRDMDDNDFIGHTSPTTGSVGDRVRAAGIQTPMALENIGRDYSATSIHAALMASPGHRANILNPHVTHVGIELVRQQEGVAGQEGSRQALLVTQVFIQVVEAIDPKQAADDGVSKLAQRRSSGGLAALQRDGALDELARAGAAHYFAGGVPSQAQVAAQVDAAMRKQPLPYTQVQAVVLVGSQPQLADVDALLDPKARAIGVGMAQGQRKDARVNPVTIAVVLLGY